MSCDLEEYLVQDNESDSSPSCVFLHSTKPCYSTAWMQHIFGIVFVSMHECVSLEANCVRLPV